MAANVKVVYVGTDIFRVPKPDLSEVEGALRGEDSVGERSRRRLRLMLTANRIETGCCSLPRSYRFSVKWA
jgi:hypothetical protein